MSRASSDSARLSAGAAPGTAGRGDGGPAECARLLRAGEIVAHPAESVYGFGGLLDPRPLDALRKLKDRPSGGFVVLVAGTDEVADLLGSAGRALARAFWPGPLTLVVDDPANRFPVGAKAADGSVAVRVPGCAETLALLREAGRPMTSTSANAPGRPPAVTAAEARAAARSLGREMAVLDAGRLPGGLASTLVRLESGRAVLLRRGRAGVQALAEALAGGCELVVPGEPGPGAGRGAETASAEPVSARRTPRRALDGAGRGGGGASEPFAITFVCTGNTCRSPMAEALARRAAARRGMRGVEVRSAGVAAWPGQPASCGAMRAAAESGLDLKAHRSRLLTRETAESSSLLLCMASGHVAQAEAMGGRGRCRLLKEMAGGSGEVADPFGGSDGAYRETFAELEAAVEAVMEHLARRA